MIGETPKDFVFDLQFLLIWQLIPVVAECLDAVVLPRIVRRGDDNARVKSTRSRQISDAGCSDDPGTFHRGSALPQPGGNGCTDPLARFAGVHSQHYSRLCAVPPERVRKGQPNRVDGARIERCFARNCSNSVGPKKLPHILSSIRDTVLVTVPLASRVLRDSPIATAELSRTSLPALVKVRLYPRSRTASGESAVSRP